MNIDSSNVLWLHRSQLVSVSELIDLSGLSEDEIRELVDMGALVPIDAHQVPWRFSAECVLTVRSACRLRHDLELDTHALALALDLLAQIDALESELSQLRARQFVFANG